MGKLIRPFNEPKFETDYGEAITHDVMETNTNEIKNDLLLTQFRFFINEVLKIINTSKITNQPNYINSDFEEKKDENTNEAETQKRLLDPPEKKIAKDTSDFLSKVINVQNMELMRKGSKSQQNRFEETKYLKAAIADELLLKREWAGRKFFTDYLVEDNLFGTSIAGEKVFKDINLLLESPPGRQPEIEQMYLFALAIGFEGKYRGNNSEKEINNILRQLFSHITRREPELGPKKLDAEITQRLVSKQTYRHTISNIKPIRIFRFSKQSVIFTIFFLALLVISQFLWVWFSSPLRNALDQLVNNMDSVQSVVKKINNSEVIVILSKFEKLNG